MKRFKIISLITLVIMLFSITSVVFAYDDYCYVGYNGEHNFEYSITMASKHPHAGSRTCFCGDKVYLEHQYDDECETCRKELCRKGIHCYLYDIEYLDEYGYTGYGECYCGRKKYFSYSDYRLEREPYEGFITFFDSLHSAKHPHYEYDTYTGRYYYESTLHTDSCGVCKLENQYYDDIKEYELATLIYGDSYFEDDYYEEEYDNYYEDEWYDEYDEEYWYEYDDYADEWYDFEEDDYSYDEDEDFYEWLDLVQEILNE